MQTTNLLLQAGEEAQACSPRKVEHLEPLMYAPSPEHCSSEVSHGPLRRV